ncbi:hypothetical protein BDK51DRAFT_31045, partial [Blyttiomyces helicus]
MVNMGRERPDAQKVPGGRSGDLSSKISDLLNKIDIESKCKKGAEAMLAKLRDPDALQQCQMNLADSTRRLDFLLSEMHKLQVKRNRLTGEPVEDPLAMLSAADPGSPITTATTAGFPSSPTTGSKDDAYLRPPSNPPRARKRNSDPGVPSLSVDPGTPDPVDPADPTSPGAANPRPPPAGGPHGANRLSMTAQMLGTILSSLRGRGSKSGTSTPKSVGSSSSSLHSLAGGPDGGAVTQFDFLKCETPITSEKVLYKLSEIRFKADVEQKVKAGTERMRIAMVDGPADAVDRKRQQEVEEKMAESNIKVAVLVKALQRYQGLYVAGDEEAAVPDGGETVLNHAPDPAGDDEPRFSVSPTDGTAPPLKRGMMNSESASSLKPLRRPATGRLKLRLCATSGLPGKKSYKTDTYAVVRVDGVQRAKSRPTRGKYNEDFDIPVDRAQEVEVAIYEKGGVMLALMWFKLWELEEELRIRASAPVEGADSDAHHQGGVVVEEGKHADGVETWFDLEPAGQVLLKLNFVTNSGTKRRKDGVFRRKPVQKIFPKRGHKFVALQFYQVMKCAICTEFLMSGQGYQCQ